jgi:death-on-curing protein
MKPWQWVREDVVHAIHDRQLAEHSGPDGVRDEAALESALACPRKLAAYQRPDGAALAAAYAYGMVRNHPFVDGNKHTGWVIARLFLARNGYRLQFDPHDAVRTIEKLVAGKLSEPEVGDWFRQRIQRK